MSWSTEGPSPQPSPREREQELRMATQEHGADFGVREQRLTRVLIAILSHGQDISAVGTLQRLARILLDDEDGDTGTIDLDDLLKHHAHQHWRQAGRWLVQHEQARIEHEGPG